MTDPHLLTGVRQLVKRAILTLLSLPDRDKACLNSLGKGWPFAVVAEANQSYGYNQAFVRFVPTSRDISNMDKVMPMLAWLRRADSRAVIRLFAWARGASNFKLADIEGVTERTIQNRIDRSVIAIINEFGIEPIDDIEPVDEPAGRPPRIQGWDDGTPRESASGHAVEAGKVYIAGMGFRFRGKSIGDPHERALRQAENRGKSKKRGRMAA